MIIIRSKSLIGVAGLINAGKFGWYNAKAVAIFPFMFVRDKKKISFDKKHGSPYVIGVSRIPQSVSIGRWRDSDKMRAQRGTPCQQTIPPGPR